MGDEFYRMWEFYLAISELSFVHGKHMNFQIQLTKDVNALPITRDYMVDERELEGKARALWLPPLKNLNT